MRKLLSTIALSSALALAAGVAQAEATASAMSITFTGNAGGQVTLPGGVEFSGVMPTGLSIATAAGHTAAASASADAATQTTVASSYGTDDPAADVVAGLEGARDGRAAAGIDRSDAFETTIVLGQVAGR